MFFILFLYVPSSAQEPQSPVSVNADSIEHDRQSGDIRASGGVSVRYGDIDISGDSAEINVNTRSGAVDGNVKLKTPSGDITADSMDFDIDSKTGTLQNAAGLINNLFRVTAKKAERKDERTFLFNMATLTSCVEENPDWLLESDKIKITMEEFATFKNVKFNFFGIPVFYSPWFAVPAVTKRSTGFLIPGVGYSSTDGAFLKNAFYWARSEQDDATFYLDAYGERGLREGLEYRYAYAPRTYGKFNLDYIYDNSLNDDIWSVKYDHRQMFGSGIDTRARLDYESETSFTKEFDSDSYLRTRRYTHSFLHAEKNYDDLALSILAQDDRSIESERKETFVKKPDFRLGLMPRERFGLPALAGLNLAATSFLTDVSDSSSSSEVTVERIYARPSLSLPFSMSGTNITPWISGRAASYTKSGDGGSSFTTNYYTGGLAAEGPRFYRIFNGVSDTFKHTITPKVEYTFVPGYGVDGENRQKVEELDVLDGSAPDNTIELILLNRLFSKGRGGEIVKLTLTQGYDFNEANSNSSKKEPFTGFDINFDSQPASWLIFNTDFNYNHYDAELDDLNNEVGISFGDAFYVSYDRRYTRNDSTYSTGLAGLRISSRIGLEASLAYDELERETTDAVFRFNYLAGCWGVTFSLSESLRSEELDTGGARREKETRFFINFSLRGLGDLGEKPSHLIDRKI